jgi:sulfur relay (sulfurtransferase) complex TusBCD TusD component (DsrE family)
MQEGFYRKIIDGKLQCKDCREWKPLNNFQRHTQKGKSRHGSYCKACKRARGILDQAQARYGLSADEFKALTEAYPACAICGDVTLLCIDHNHKTGKVRGRLCKSCNTAIGLLTEDKFLLDSAKSYLTRFERFGILDS